MADRGSEVPSTDQAETLPAVQLGSARVALVATLLQLPVGVAVMLSVPNRLRDALLGEDLLAAVPFACGMLATLGLLHTLAAVALGDRDPRQVRRSLAADAGDRLAHDGHAPADSATGSTVGQPNWCRGGRSRVIRAPRTMSELAEIPGALKSRPGHQVLARPAICWQSAEVSIANLRARHPIAHGRPRIASAIWPRRQGRPYPAVFPP